tara:strand:+ start:465 stop:752 length:288 start_codon:yes stop_codon:yes gene_type:complete
MGLRKLKKNFGESKKKSRHTTHLSSDARELSEERQKIAEKLEKWKNKLDADISSTDISKDSAQQRKVLKKIDHYSRELTEITDKLEKKGVKLRQS